jgi:hypothetical protein
MIKTAKIIEIWQDGYQKWVAGMRVPKCQPAFVGVYDGHGGPQVSQWCRDHLHEVRYKSFPLYDDLADLILGAVATGEGAFNPTAAAPPLILQAIGMLQRCSERYAPSDCDSETCPPWEQIHLKVSHRQGHGSP